MDISSPIYIELQRIINTSPLDEITQLKIEQFLFNQGSILLKKRIDQNTYINYYKLNPYVLNYLKKSNDELSKLLDNFRYYINNLNNNSYFYWLINTINNKMPNWLKYLFLTILISVFLLKLLGFVNILDFVLNPYYIKIYINTRLLYGYNIMMHQINIILKYINFFLRIFFF